MDKKRDKFAKLRSKKISKIDGTTSQITNFFNPKISSSASGLIGNDILSQQSDKCNGEAPERVPEESSEDDSVHVKRLKIEEKKKPIRLKKPEIMRPKNKSSSKKEEKLLNEMLVKQSLAENINPEDLQLALALSRSIADNRMEHGECSGTATESASNSSSQTTKFSAKFTLDEYGFKSSAQHNRKALNYLAMEKDMKTFRKMSLLLHRNPKKQDRLFNEKINGLLNKSLDVASSTHSKVSSYHFLVTCHTLMECLKPESRIMALNCNPEPTWQCFAQYYRGNLVEPSCSKIDALLRNWDDIPGREMSPNRIRKKEATPEKMEVDELEKQDVQEEEICEETANVSFVSFQTPKRRSITPDLLRSDGESTAKSSVLENVSIEISSDEEIPEIPGAEENISESSSKIKLNAISEDLATAEEAEEENNCINSQEEDEALLEESVIVIESDDDDDHEEAVNQSICRIIEDHQDTKHMGRKSLSDGFILCRSRVQDPTEDDAVKIEETPPEDLPMPSEVNINSLLTDDIVMDDLHTSTPPQEEAEEVTFLCDALKNEDITVVKRRGVTPPPNYDAMAPEDIQKELKKYGLKNIKGRKARILLEHIYNQLHPFVLVKDKMYDLKCKYGLIDASTEPKELKRNQSPARNVENVIDITCKDGFLGDIDAKKCILPCPSRKKLQTCALPLHIAFYNYLQSNRQVHEKILQYNPIPLQDIQEHFKSIGVKYEANDLIEFLDKTCITFQGPNSGSRLRKTPRKKNTNSNGLTQSGESQ